MNIKKNLWWIILLILLLLFLLWWKGCRPVPQAVNNVTVDFGNRTGGTLLTPNWFGVNGLGTTLSDPVALRMFQSINLIGNRIFLPVTSVYPTSTSAPNWSKIDAQIDRTKSIGARNDVVIYNTPSDMNAQQCGMPNNPQRWAYLASSMVQHIEARYPSVAYEVWNEPDLQASFCDAPNNQQDWMTLFAAFAPLVRANAPTAKIGGPALGAPGVNANTWIPAFLSDSRTAPYVDFVSFHLYITSQYEVNNNLMNWGYLYQHTVTTLTVHGVAWYYAQIESMVRAGMQPNAAITPIDISEYNSNSAYTPTCCQNDTLYAPLWNATAMSEWMNAPQTTSAKSIPTRLRYFSVIDSHGYFCMVSNTGTSSNCMPPAAGATAVPWAGMPQYLLYQLMTSPSYLNVEATGAQVVKRPIFGTQNIYNGAVFYTPTADVLFIINPWSTNYTNIPVIVNNLGLTNIQATEYTIQQGTMLTQQATVTVNSPTQITVTANLPGYSIVVVKLTGS